MRFPKIDSMRRGFNLFEYEPLKKAFKGKLQKYYSQEAPPNNTLLDYNGVTVIQSQVPPGDSLKSKQVILDVDPTPYLAAGTKAIMNDVIGPFATLGCEIWRTTGWRELMKFDLYSACAYMWIKYRPSPDLLIPQTALPTDIVNWMETFDTSTDSYDRPLSEIILEAVAFGWKLGHPPPTSWFCIEYVFFLVRSRILADFMLVAVLKRSRESWRTTSLLATPKGSPSSLR